MSSEIRAIRKRRTFLTGPDIPHGLGQAILTAIEVVNFFIHEDVLLSAVAKLTGTQCAEIALLQRGSDRFSRILDDTAGAFSAEQLEADRVVIYAKVNRHVDDLHSINWRLARVCKDLNKIAHWALTVRGDAEPAQISAGTGCPRTVTVADILALAIRVLGSSPGHELRAQELKTHFASLPLLSSCAAKIFNHWINLWNVYFRLQRTWTSDGTLVSRRSSSLAMYGLVGTSIEQIHPALQKFPAIFSQSAFQFSRQSGPAQDSENIPPVEWNLNDFLIEFPARLLRNPVPRVSARDLTSPNLSATIVEVVRKGPGRYDLFLTATAQRSFLSRVGKSSRCKKMLITWCFAYPPGSPSCTGAPNILAFLPTYEKSNESERKITTVASAGVSLSTSIGAVSGGGASLQRTTEIVVPGWAFISGVNVVKSPEGSESANLNSVRWVMQENHATATGNDRCAIGVSIELAQPSHEIITEIQLQATYARDSGLHNFIGKGEAEVCATGKQRINLLCLQTKAILARRGGVL